MSNLECIGLKEIENLTATEFKLKCFCVKILNINEENKMSSITVSDQSGTCKISCPSKFANIIKLLIPGKSYKIFGLEQDPDPRHDLKVVNNSYFSILKENEDGSMMIRITKGKNIEEIEVDAIICACGMQPNCLAHPMIKKVHERWPIDIFGGFPVLSAQQLWAENLYVVGGLASLSVGPDAGNLMGISRAAEAVANELNSKQWIRGEESNVLTNPFEMLVYDSDSSSDEDEDTWNPTEILAH